MDSCLFQNRSSLGSWEIWACSHTMCLWQWIVALRMSPLVTSQSAHLSLYNSQSCSISHHLDVACSVHPGVGALLSSQTLSGGSGWAKDFMKHTSVLKHTKILNIKKRKNSVVLRSRIGLCGLSAVTGTGITMLNIKVNAFTSKWLSWAVEPHCLWENPCVLCRLFSFQAVIIWLEYCS